MFNILFRLHGFRPERKQFRLKLAIECGIILTGGGSLDSYFKNTTLCSIRASVVLKMFRVL